MFFEVAFDASYLVGMLVGGGVTLAYTLIGRFLGASLTDVVQGTMMMIALLVVPVVVFVSLEVVDEAVEWSSGG